MRGTTNTNVRGSAEGRRRRKQALLKRDGNGITAPCWECRVPVTAQTMIADRVIPGCRGGTYRLSNLRVHCRICSEAQGRRMSAESRRWACWQRRGLRRSQVTPAGRRDRGVWYVYLDGVSVGYLLYGPSGKNWTACRFDGPEDDLAGQQFWDGQPVTDPADRSATIVALRKTLREATYALLVEHTQPKRERQAA